MADSATKPKYEPIMLSQKDAAAYTGLTNDWFRHKIQSRTLPIPYKKVASNRNYYLKEDLDRLIESFPVVDVVNGDEPTIVPKRASSESRKKPKKRKK